MPENIQQIRAALLDVVPSLVALIRDLPDAGARAVGTWSVGDVAAHLSHVFRFDTDAIAARPVPSAVVTSAGMASLNAQLLADDSERTPAALADRIAVLAAEFADVSSCSAAVDWLQGVRLPPAAVAGHLLEECLMHGHDIATAVGRTWPIKHHHALLAVEAGVLPLISALPPTAFVKPEVSFRARFEVRLRGGGRTWMVFDDGLTLDTEPGRDVDACLFADPAALMLVFIGRQPLWKPVLAGQLAAWGPRPWKLARMLKVISPP